MVYISIIDKTKYSIGIQPQQCPYDFPYVFDDGKSCCRHNKDNEGLTLAFSSSTCENDLKIPCVTERCRANGENMYQLKYNSNIILLSTNNE